MTDNKLTLKEKLSKIQVELKAPKNLYNSFGKYKYRNVEGIQEALKPMEKEFKVTTTLSDRMVEVGSRVYVEATATIWDCDSDESISITAYAREAESKKGMDDAQVTGATSSYARKYALNGLFLLDDTKDVDTEEYQSQARKPDTKKKSNDNLPFEIETEKTYREKLREFCKENQIETKTIIQMCGLSDASTDEDYKDAFEYAIKTFGA